MGALSARCKEAEQKKSVGYEEKIKHRRCHLSRIRPDPRLCHALAERDVKGLPRSTPGPYRRRLSLPSFCLVHQQIPRCQEIGNAFVLFTVEFHNAVRKTNPVAPVFMLVEIL